MRYKLTNAERNARRCRARNRPMRVVLTQQEAAREHKAGLMRLKDIRLDAEAGIIRLEVTQHAQDVAS